jgi:hypothetical protein
MRFPDDPRRAEALAKPIADVADLLCIEGLRRAGVERVGPCPQCGGDDRFGINPRKGVFGCRKCGAKGDGIALVMHVRQVTFPEALDWLCGPRQEISAAERAQRDQAAEANRQARAAEAAQYRARAVADAGVAVCAVGGLGLAHRAYVCAHLARQLLVAAQAVVLHHREARRLDLDRLVKVLQREALAVPEAVVGLGHVLAHKIVRHVAVVARRNRMVRTLFPRVVLVTHDVAVDARLGVVAHVARPLGVH